ncbi:hypothetical protein F5883DRAFT_524803 [Diaporthe sp. PMI_573]|nr:hypothetical protein F5883DRAFT_524803 [Diaporthaceae sp. PMI_573]
MSPHRVVDEKIATALVLEDDVDWDVNVRQQMARIVHEFEQDQSTLTADWEYSALRVILTSGGTSRFPKDDERKIVFQDPTVPSRGNLSPGFNSVKSFPEHSRVIHPSDFPLCTYAYAVSYAGAQKILITPPLFHFDRNKDFLASDWNSGRNVGMERDSDTDQAFVKHNQEPGSYKKLRSDSG